MNQMNTIPGTAIVAAVKGHVFCELDGEAVILQFRTGTYYGLNPVGCVVWTFIQEPRTFGQIVSKLTADFDVELARCQADLQVLLRDLSNAGLVEVTVGAGS